MNNKIILILTAISISLAAFLGGYLVSQSDFKIKPSGLSGNVLEKFNGTKSPTSQTNSPSELTAISRLKAVSPASSKDNNGIIYYEKNTGRVLEVNLESQKENSVSETILPNFVKTVWSPSRKEVVGLFYSPKGTHYKYYDYLTRASADLGVKINSLVFAPSGNLIAYFTLDGDSSGIFISQPDGSSPKKVFDTRLAGLDLYWPADEFLSFKTQADNGYDLFKLSTTGDLTKILDSQPNLEVKWSHAGKKVLFSSTNDSGNLRLSYEDIASGDEKDLGVSASADKCAWNVDDSVIICAVPRSSDSGEDIYEIGLDGAKKLVVSPNFRLNTSEIFLSSLDDYIVVLNGLDDNLYAVKR